MTRETGRRNEPVRELPRQRARRTRRGGSVDRVGLARDPSGIRHARKKTPAPCTGVGLGEAPVMRGRSRKRAKRLCRARPRRNTTVSGPSTTAGGHPDKTGGANDTALTLRGGKAAIVFGLGNKISPAIRAHGSVG